MLRFVTSLMIMKIACLFTLLLGSAELSLADDWPQILGKQRNGIAQNEKIADSWPNTGPELKWSKLIGSGYAGPVIVKNQVILFHRLGASELVESFDLKTGTKQWSREFPASYRASINPDDGPRCVPLVVQNKIYLFGAAGDLYCVSLSDGKRNWEVNLGQDFSAPEGYFGAGSTPIYAEGNILVNLGGRSGAGIVAVNAETGKLAWKATDEAASYSSPTLAKIDGKNWVIFITRMNVIAIDPKDGSVGLSFPFGARGPTVNAASPLVFNDQLFVTASYGVGAKLVKLSRDNFNILWENDDTLSSQYNTPILFQGHLYGIDGREDIGIAQLRCVEMKSGKIKWTRDNFFTANLILADGKLIAINKEGQAFLIKADPGSYQQLSKFRAFQDTPRALPALSNGYLVARDTSADIPGNQGGRLKCFFVGTK